MVYCAQFSILGLLLLAIPVKTLGCYKCRSENGSSHLCEDPFNSTMSFYEDNCMAPRYSRNGLFPGQFCYKINGKTAGGSIFIRDCTVENMQNMCGQFGYEEKLWTGCIQTCTTDGCNNSNISIASWLVIVIGLAAVFEFPSQ